MEKTLGLCVLVLLAAFTLLCFTNPINATYSLIYHWDFGTTYSESWPPLLPMGEPCQTIFSLTVAKNSDPCRLIWIGIRFEWMPNNEYLSMNFSSSPKQIQPSNTASFGPINFTVPLNIEPKDYDYYWRLHFDCHEDGKWNSYKDSIQNVMLVQKRIQVTINQNQSTYNENETCKLSVYTRDPNGNLIEPDNIIATFNNNTVTLTRTGTGTYNYTTLPLKAGKHNFTVVALREEYIQGEATTSLEAHAPKARGSENHKNWILEFITSSIGILTITSIALCAGTISLKLIRRRQPLPEQLENFCPCVLSNRI